MNRLLLITTFMFVLFASGCEVEPPLREDVPELITKVTLTFTPAVGDALVVTATDPDGEGVQDVQVDGDINLKTMETYHLSLTLTNGLAAPSDPEYDVTEEVEEEGHEHLFYFSWTNEVFGVPSGDGNIDNRSDPMNYDDEDVNGLPLGLQTTWTTAAASSGDFRVVLKHQPDLKSVTSESTVGETDVDITFTLNVE